MATMRTTFAGMLELLCVFRVRDKPGFEIADIVGIEPTLNDDPW